MKIRYLISVFLGMYSSFSYAETAKDALSAISKLNVRTEMGISYKDYAVEVAATKHIVNEFVSGTKDKKSKCVESIETVMNLHVIALGFLRSQVNMNVYPLISPPIWTALDSSTNTARTDCKNSKN